MFDFVDKWIAFHEKNKLDCQLFNEAFNEICLGLSKHRKGVNKLVLEAIVEEGLWAFLNLVPLVDESFSEIQRFCGQDKLLACLLFLKRYQFPEVKSALPLKKVNKKKLMLLSKALEDFIENVLDLFWPRE